MLPYRRSSNGLYIVSYAMALYTHTGGRTSLTPEDVENIRLVYDRNLVYMYEPTLIYEARIRAMHMAMHAMHVNMHETRIQA